MSNIYYSPEKFGLETIGEVVNWNFESYRFDFSVMFRDPLTGEFFVASDSGCSCPEPFEFVGRDDLTPIKRLQDLLDHFAVRDEDYWSESERAGVAGSKARLVAAYQEAKRRA